ncbi:copper resistance protein NlpE N-terminal domain-containing protein [Flavobacterium sp. AC]|uniref:Copper resistance protein NlpE N-terminal domain-containing protein n=1 Tax=Flavobacterium azizsancarii TaxID=2961580 RepID=A0ABT4WC55_9FLAO|nr:copper resistance protein NlpE N-terminal domain-containing protein [Flavobacterium azizsancarii]MDA6070117.1 copper resistance protein NlpE N-terminal domain-containing protein [Flavobacterium azizsancarii]
MKNLILAFLVAFQLLSCNSKQKEETPEHSANVVDNDTTNDESKDEVAVYEGLLPCADCEGIETVLKIYRGDGTMESHKFELSTIYKGKAPEKKLEKKGNFNLERGLGNDPDGTIYVLNYDKPQSEQIFYGYSADNPDKIFLLNSKREKIKSKLDYSLSLNE